MAEVESALERVAAAPGGPLAEDATATLAAGGKRLRPLLVLLCAGPEAGAPALSAAVAVELIHMATLVHDDVLDAAPLRRGRPTVLATSGRPRATATGDLLFARAFAELATEGERRQVALLTTASVALARGELAQRRDAFDVGRGRGALPRPLPPEDRGPLRVRLRDRRRGRRPRRLRPPRRPRLPAPRRRARRHRAAGAHRQGARHRPARRHRDDAPDPRPRAGPRGRRQPTCAPSTPPAPRSSASGSSRRAPPTRSARPRAPTSPPRSRSSTDSPLDARAPQPPRPRRRRRRRALRVAASGCDQLRVGPHLGLEGLEDPHEGDRVVGRGEPALLVEGLVGDRRPRARCRSPARRLRRGPCGLRPAPRRLRSGRCWRRSRRPACCGARPSPAGAKPSRSRS